MTRKWIPESLEGLLLAFDRGTSVNALSKQNEVGRRVITRVLIENGRNPRSISEEGYLRAARETPDQRKANATKAHAALRGRLVPPAVLEKRARVKQKTKSHASDSELSLAQMLCERGIEDVVLQHAAGIYNIDVAAAPVAIEVFGGGWHAYGHHRRRTERRYRYLLDHGWSVLIIWCLNVCPRPDIAAANYAAAYIGMVRDDPRMLGEFRVIRADGKFVLSGRDRLERIALLPDNKRRKDWAVIE